MNGESVQRGGIDEQLYDLREMMLDQLRKLKEWMNEEKHDKKRSIFVNREPIGTVTTPILNIGFCNALKSRDNTLRPRVNEIVLIYDKKHDEIYSGIIEELKVIPRKKSERKSPDDPESDFIFGIRLLSKHESNLAIRKNIDTLISEDSFVFTATPREIEIIYGIPKKGLKLGVCSYNGDMIQTQEDFLYYKLDPDLLKTHMYIGGLTGQGKTILLKNIIYQLAKRQFVPPVNSIVFDLQGDLVQMMKPMLEEIIPEKFKHGYEEMDLEYEGLESLLPEDEVMFLKPYYVKVKGFLRMFKWRNFGFRSYHVTSGEELANFVPYLTDKGRTTLVALFSMFMERVESFHFETFYQWVLNNRNITKKGNYQWFLPNSNEFVEAAGSTGDAMIRELSKFRKLQVFDTVEEINTVEMLKKKLVFIYFPNIEGYSVLRSIFLMGILKDIYEKKVLELGDLRLDNGVHGGRKDQESDTDTGSTDLEDGNNHDDMKGKDQEIDSPRDGNGNIPDVPEPPAIMSREPRPATGSNDDEGMDADGILMEEGMNNLIIIDEAHELLPSRSRISHLSKDFFKFIEKEFNKIAKEGRKYGISLLVATQLVSDLNAVVEQNAQTKIYFELSPRDVKRIKPDKEVKNFLGNLKRGQAIVYSRDNLAITKATEIRIIPPVFLHCDPATAFHFFKDKIREVVKERGELVELTPRAVVKPPLTKKDKDDTSKKPAIDFLDELGLDKLVSSRITNLHNKSVLDVDINLVLSTLEKELRKVGLHGKHLHELLENFVVALHSEETIGIKLLGPSGEGKSQFAFAVVNSLCIGGTKAFYAVSESTMEEDLFFGVNPKALADKDQPTYNLGVVCQSLVHRTFPILDEANRAPERIYGGKALTALAGDRKIMMPGNQLIQAPKDWKIIFIMNPVDLGTFSFPSALENRLMTLEIPYANDDVARLVLSKILPDHPNVVESFVTLRRKTMQVCPLGKQYHYIPESERKLGEIQLNAISMRVVDRFGHQFLKYLSLLKDKKKAFKRAVDANCYSVFINQIPEEREYFNSLVNAVLEGIG
ncbi:AAA domain-containing protein [Candidatus Bathyarchaeota archaeon]|nr:AAA domain-containing protein [Candidatus Bathyarchaeota archaeon]